MSESITVFEVLCFLVTVQASVFLVTGWTHVVRPGRLRLVGVFELLLTGALIGSLFSGVATLATVEAVVVLYAIGLAVFVARLFVRASCASCGCHPWAGPVGAASFIPTIAMLLAAAIGMSVALTASFDAMLSTRDVWTFVLACISGGAALVVAGALSPPLEPEGG